ncbi:MAG: hydantoinase/oxoprolinase family protein [Geminicoccaceae bacterium]
MRTKYRLGVDAGGTFTDFVLADETGRVRLYKTPSTPADPTRAISTGLLLIAEDLGESIDHIVSNCDLCINGTTVALNALLQHKGVKVGLICTAGHEDSIEIRLGHKEDGYRYDHQYPPAVMLVPRYLRRPIRERVISTGEVRTPLNEDDVREAVRFFQAEGCEAIAVSFVWSVLNTAHEQRAAAIVREMAPDLFLSVGSDIYPQVREYTRTSTTILNAYLGPILKRYCDSVDGWFRNRGATYPVRYFQSNGGLAIGSVASAKAVYAINSGPASAPQAGLFVAEPFGQQNIITVDMGGTSFDITLTKDGRTNISKNIDFQRYRLGVPMIQVETLGAGGGSIGWINELGLLQVGPQSAGAVPGPACYGQGGEQPTVTDANLVLGYLSGEGLLAGKMPLDVARARAAIRSKVAEPLGISVERAAYGIFTIVNNNMVNGIRRVSVERGYDPRDFVLVVGGGASAAHITALAREMGIGTVLVPKLASGLCAYGQIISDVKYNFMASYPIRLEDNEQLGHVQALFGRLEATGREALAEDGFAPPDIDYQRSVDMRYVGQVHECTVDIGKLDFTSANLEAIKQAFHARHEQLFTYCEPQSGVEVVNIESTLFGRVSKPKQSRVSGGGSAAAARKGERPMIFAQDGTVTSAAVYDGTKLAAGEVVSGPAVIEEPTTTIVLEPGWKSVLHETGTYVLTREG